MEKIRICFAAIYAYQLFDRSCKVAHGGAEVDLYLLAKEFAKDKRFEVVFIVGNFGQKKEQIFDGIKVIVGFPDFKKDYKYISLFLKQAFLFNVLRKVNATVYVQEMADTITAVISLYCKLFGKKFIYRLAHMMECDWKFIRETGRLGKLYYFGLKRATRVICQNNDQKKLLKENFGIDATIIRNGHPVDKKPVSDRNYVLWVARCETWKRPEIFLDIVRKFPQYNFVMICPMLKHEEVLFQKISSEAKNLKNLEFIEKVPFAKIQPYFDGAKIFIGTSDHEGFPNTYLQACLGSTPIISLNVNPDNFIDEYKLGYCAGGNLESMLEKISKLLDDKEELKAKSMNAHRYVKENHDIVRIKKQWEEVILEK